jgi:hypothetical protein
MKCKVRANIEHESNSAESAFRRTYYENDRYPCTNLVTTLMKHALTKCNKHERKMASIDQRESKHQILKALFQSMINA